MNLLSKRKLIFVLAIIGIALVTSFLVLRQRPASLPAFVHLPDEKHLHQVFAENEITQRTTVQSTSIDGISFFIDSSSKTPGNSQLILHVREPGDSQDLRTVIESYGSANKADVPDTSFNDLENVPDESSLVGFQFSPITNAKERELEFTLEAPGLDKNQALRIRYQSDSQKLSFGKSFSGTVEKQGNIGFLLYERPTAAQHILRWLIAPDRRHLLFGLVLMAAAAVALKIHGLPEAAEKTMYWESISKKALVTWYVGIFFAAFIVYWPATNQYYFHDDLALLARVEEFSETAPWKIISAHDYLEKDEYSKFDLYFWRPVSAGLFSTIIWNTAGLNTAIAYGINIALIGLSAIGLFVLSTMLLRSTWAAGIASFAWLTHSTKLGTVFWWSSNHDILASFFGIFSLICFVLWRTKNQRKYLLGSIALYVVAFLSKEHLLLLPIIAFFIDWFFLQPKRKTTFLAISPIIITTCILLLIRALVFSDPSLPHSEGNNSSYDIKLTPSMLGTNMLTYAGWSAENWIWPRTLPGVARLESALSPILEPTRLQQPYYPAALLLTAWLILLIVTSNNSRLFHILVFGSIWWLVFLGPLLFFQNDWRYRWLYLPIFGVCFGLAALFTLLSANTQKKVATVVIPILLIYGAWHTRLPDRTRFYREQSAYIQEAAQQYEDQQNSNPEHIILVGVRPDQTTSLNAYLFRLLGASSPVPLERTDTYPEEQSPNDVVVDMTNKEAYYPGYEQ